MDRMALGYTRILYELVYTAMALDLDANIMITVMETAQCQPF